jgi:two-component sensor histidine kinase
MFMTGIGLFALASIGLQSSYWIIAAAPFAIGIGLGLITGPIATVAVANAPAERSGMSRLVSRFSASYSVHGAELSTIAGLELAPYSTSRDKRVRIDGPQVLLEPDIAQAVAVTLHELATNAAKYGALSTANGHIDLKWSHEANGRLNLRWIETGGPTVEPPVRSGFGGRIIQQMIAQLKGESRFDWRAEGLVCEITLRV